MECMGVEACGSDTCLELSVKAVGEEEGRISGGTKLVAVEGGAEDARD